MRPLPYPLSPLALSAVCLLVLPAAMPAAEPSWPQFHGPRRDNTSDETDLLREWPSGGPELLWTARGIGFGFSSIAVAGGLLYTAGNIEGHTVVTALEPGGRIRWQVKSGPAYERSHPGTRSTPTFDGGRLYHQNADGDLVCLDAKTGERVWGLNVLEKFGGRNITWGLAESVLVDGEKVISTPGGEEIGVVALDKRSGETIWAMKGAGDKPGYCSPIVIEHQGLRQIVTMLARSVVGIRAEDGKLLWQVENIAHADENITTPIFHEGRIITSTLTSATRSFRLKVDGRSATVEEEWKNLTLDNQHGGILLVGGYIYGCGRRGKPGPWMCLDASNGKQMYGSSELGPGAFTYAAGRLHVLDEARTVALVRATPESFEVVSRFRLPEGGEGPTWAHPVICGGRLFIRHGDLLYCYRIEGEGKGEGRGEGEGEREGQGEGGGEDRARRF